jgi:hypothetical protein
MKLIWLIQIYLNETCSKVHIGKYLFHMLPIQNGCCFSSLLLKYRIIREA